ncbi:hypothetical protein BT93_L0561 [Corymbia citriodora subsp. variegata]|uniref:ABC transmembrane type-1 domain-containing protein n=1 Tax=Corymbia citriodora subsp. variegata TaxID=360336 RepID=A0A8T0CYE9_CORYI|nr:hypothetical protein BT93_L0561 [Corymbia citriodora subsp. variegata]
MVPFHKLFSFVDSTDILLMVVGSISAIWNGLSLPLMTELFGQLINTFGKNQADSDVVDLVSKNVGRHNPHLEYHG